MLLAYFNYLSIKTTPDFLERSELVLFGRFIATGPSLGQGGWVSFAFEAQGT